MKFFIQEDLKVHGHKLLTQVLQVQVFELGPKIFEMNEFTLWKPWTAQFCDHLAFALLSNKSCENFELRNFFLSPQNVHLKALLYYFKYCFLYIHGVTSL